MRAAALLAVALAVALPCAAQTADGPALAARASRGEVTVGERFAVEVEARGPAGATWTFPPQAGDDKVELRLAPADPAAPPRPGTARYEAAVFALGEVEVPPLAAEYRLADGTRGAARSAPIPLRVVTLLPKDPAAQTLADVRPPVRVPAGAAFWAGLATALAALAAIVVALWRWRRRRRGAPEAAPAPAVPPDQEALAALDRLEASDLPERREFRAYYIELAQVAKRYLERRLDAPVLEMTSLELSAFLRDHALAGDFLPVVRELTAAADVIKFARGESEVQIARAHLGTVRGLVRDLEQRARAAEAPPAAEAIR